MNGLDAYKNVGRVLLELSKVTIGVGFGVFILLVLASMLENVGVSFGIGGGLTLGHSKADCISPMARSACHWVSPPPSIPTSVLGPPTIPTSVPVQCPGLHTMEGPWSFIIESGCT